ncbi:MAG: restriction endonuclease subunit S [Eubacterium sp.]|nr:restriction endonuclease subunit S [Eubacterium sp.]
MVEKNKNPQIRFDGFTDDWEQRKLGDIGETYTGLSGKTKEDFGHGNAKFVTYMNVFSNSIADSSMTESVEIDKKQNEVNYGDVFFTTSSETPDEVGMSSVWLENSENTYLNSFCFGYRPSVEINPYYMAYMLRSENVRKNIVFLAQGISRYNISKNKMMEISVPLPELDEQQKIGEYFHDLDNLITIHQRKYEKLLFVKKSMLEKMFPQNGSGVPEIRFEGFTDAWEQRKVSELCSISTGKSNTQDKVEDGVYPFYVRSPIIERSAKYLYDEEAVLTVGDGVGTGKVFHYVNGKYDLHQRCYRMYDFSEQLNAHYFYHTFSKLFYKRVMAMTAKTSVDSVRLEMIADMEIPCPNIKEQEEIGAFFDNLDNLITLHQRKVEKLKQIKKSMLQNMFP